jgi:hypothetical protein
MVIAGIPTDQLLHTRAAQDLLDRGRQEGEAQGEARGREALRPAVTLRLLNRRCGPLSDATTARIQALPLEQLEALAEALLDFSVWHISKPFSAARFSAAAPAAGSPGLVNPSGRFAAASDFVHRKLWR